MFEVSDLGLSFFMQQPFEIWVKWQHLQQPISHVVTRLQPDALCGVTYLKIAYSDGVTLTCVFIIIPPIVKILPVSANEIE